MTDPIMERRRKSYEYAVSLSNLDKSELTSFEWHLNHCREIADAQAEIGDEFDTFAHWRTLDLFQWVTQISKGALPPCADIEDGLHKVIAAFALLRSRGGRPIDLQKAPPAKSSSNMGVLQSLARMPLGVSHYSTQRRKTAIHIRAAMMWRAGLFETRKEFTKTCAKLGADTGNVDKLAAKIDANTAKALRIVYSKSKWHALRRHKRAEAPPSSDTLVQRPEGGFRSLADLRTRADADRVQRAARAVDAISMPNMERAARYEQARKERAEALRLQRQAEREERRREHEKTQEWKEKRIAELIRKGYGNAAIREKAGVSTAYHLPPEVEDFTRPKGHGGHYWSERMEYIARAMRRAIRKRVPVEVYLQEYGLTPRVFTYALRFNAFNQVAPSNCVKIPPSWKAKGEPLYDTSADPNTGTNEHAREAAVIAAE